MDGFPVSGAPLRIGADGSAFGKLSSNPSKFPRFEPAVVKSVSLLVGIVRLKLYFEFHAIGLHENLHLFPSPFPA